MTIERGEKSSHHDDARGIAEGGEGERWQNVKNFNQNCDDEKKHFFLLPSVDASWTMPGEEKNIRMRNACV